MFFSFAGSLTQLWWQQSTTLFNLIITGKYIDISLALGKESESDTMSKVQTGEEMEESKIHSPSRKADSVSKDGDNLCTACGFSAKCPRSLKIHCARRHGSNSKNSDNTAKPTAKSETENISDVSLAEEQLEADMETESGVEESDLLELRSAANDNGKSLTKKQRAVDKQQADQGEGIPTQERRVSKRTPKPKMIYSCNFCGQEFRDKPPLDVHIQRYHNKGTPYTCKYFRIEVIFVQIFTSDILVLS